MSKIFVSASKTHGLGIFARKGLKAYEVLEICPVIELKKSDLPNIEKTSLKNYYFEWKKGGAIALGAGSLYNHSFYPNAEYIHDYKSSTLIFRTLRKIKAGEEIFVNYNGNYWDKNPIWFNPKNI